MLVLQDRVVSPVLNPQPGGPVDCSVSGLSPSTCPAWESLPGDKSPAGLALGVTGTHRLPDRYKVAIQQGDRYTSGDVGWYPDTDKHMVCTIASWSSQQQPHAVVISHYEFSDAVLFTTTPQVGSIQRCTIRSNEWDLHRHRAHAEFTKQHDCLSIQLLVLPIDILVISQLSYNIGDCLSSLLLIIMILLLLALNFISKSAPYCVHIPRSCYRPALCGLKMTKLSVYIRWLISESATLQPVPLTFTFKD